jgi:hypothetical protein
MAFGHDPQWGEEIDNGEFLGFLEGALNFLNPKSPKLCSGQFRSKKFIGPLEKSLEMPHYTVLYNGA